MTMKMKNASNERTYSLVDPRRSPREQEDLEDNSYSSYTPEDLLNEAEDDNSCLQCKSHNEKHYYSGHYTNVYVPGKSKTLRAGGPGFKSLLLPYIFLILLTSFRLCAIDAAETSLTTPLAPHCYSNQTLSKGCAAYTDDGKYSNVACISADLHTWPRQVPCSLRVLLLKGNQIQDLDPPGRFWPRDLIANITSLSLELNNIEFIDGATFHGFLALRSLSLRQNRISTTNWMSSLYSSGQLQALDLADNQLEGEITEDWLPVALDHLKSLDLSGNNINGIQKQAFSNVRANLTELRLASNVLEYVRLDSKVFENLTSLQLLDLSDNSALRDIPQLKLSKSVTELDLHQLPQVTRIRARTFEFAPNIQRLDLSKCTIRFIEPGWLYGNISDSLEELDLSGNAFAIVHKRTFVGNNPEWNYTLPRLKWLSVASNSLLDSFEDNALAYLPKLQHLFLQDCEKITRLNIVALEHRYHRDGLKKTFPELRNLWLFGNPWIQCDCYVRSVKFVYTDNSSCNAGGDNSGLVSLDQRTYYYKNSCRVVEDTQATVCYSYRHGEHIKVPWNLPDSELLCPEEPDVFFLAMIIGPIAFGIAIVLAFICAACSVFQQRFHRYQSGMYDLLNQQRAYLMAGQNQQPGAGDTVVKKQKRIGDDKRIRGSGGQAGVSRMKVKL